MIETVLAFIDMGDHGPYVWSAWGIALVILGIMAVVPVLRWRAFKTRAEAVRDAHSSVTECNELEQQATDASA